MATKYLTRQQIFNKVAKHLLIQRKQCADAGGTCLYRGPKGMKCAAGCLIPMRVRIGKSWNGSAWGSLPDSIRETAKIDPYDDFLVRDLQRLHDNPVNWIKHKIKLGLKEIAAENGLSTEVLKGFRKI